MVLGVDEAVINPKLGQLIEDRPLVLCGDDVFFLFIWIIWIVKTEDIDCCLGTSFDLGLDDVDGLG